MKYESRLVASHWSKTDCAASEKNYYCFPPIVERSCRLIFDESSGGRKDWCEYWTVEKYLREKLPFENALSICCGFGEIELSLTEMNVASRITGIDIAPGAIEQARKNAEEAGVQGVEYRVADINIERFEPESFDLIWANGALHHIRELEKVVPMLHASLKPGGYLVANEYVGPRYQQIPKRQQELVNAVKHLLPVELRTRLKKETGFRSRLYKKLKDLYFCGPLPGRVYGRIWRPLPIAYFKAVDPSECISSDRIIPVLKENFSTCEVKDFGGSILMYALEEEFFENFDPANDHHKRLLKMLFGLEDSLMATGDIPSDNAHIICMK